MSQAAYPEGLAAIKQEPIWADTVAGLLRQTHGKTPSSKEIARPDKDIERQAIEILLRELHARQAELLATSEWHLGKDRYHLIENPELRESFGEPIGLIAYSHWWSLDQLRRPSFAKRRGAPAGLPIEWTSDLVKLACLLRVSDACHIDERRAPSFLRALRQPKPGSAAHWTFQGNLNQPVLEGGRLRYTSKRQFSIDDAAAWWQCLDSLQMADRELRQTDAFLTEHDRRGLKARGVWYAEDPNRLSEVIQTKDWEPFDARVRVSNVAKLVRSLGGEELYGLNPTVSLRELIQNSADAVRARRLLDKRPDDWGEITIRIGKDSTGSWIDIDDNGIGMSSAVLMGPLLDFGQSYWGSHLMREEFPGLLSKGLEPTGQYGIGFFSAFMLGDRVRVTTRRYDRGFEETRIMEITQDLANRPILRKAGKAEYRHEGGTCVRVWLRVSPNEAGGLLAADSDGCKSLEELCRGLCPTLDVTLSLLQEDGKKSKVIVASDWMTIDAAELMGRICRDESQKVLLESDAINVIRTNLQLLINKEGNLLGRACILPNGSLLDQRYHGSGVVTVGGFQSCNLSNICGVLIGTPTRAARDIAIPSVDDETLAAWSSVQARLVSNLTKDQHECLHMAGIIRQCGGDTCDLPIAFFADSWISYSDICRAKNLPEEIVVFNMEQIFGHGPKRRKPKVNLGRNVLVTQSSVVTCLLQWNDIHPSAIHAGGRQRDMQWLLRWPKGKPFPGPWEKTWMLGRTLEGAVVEALAVNWQCTVQEILQVSDFANDGREYPVGTKNGESTCATGHAFRKPKRKKRKSKAK